MAGQDRAGHPGPGWDTLPPRTTHVHSTPGPKHPWAYEALGRKVSGYQGHLAQY